MSEGQSSDGQWTTPSDSPLIPQGSIQQGGMFNCWPPPVPSQNVAVNPTGTVLQPIPLRISAASSTGLADMNYRPSTPYLSDVEVFRGASAICEREQYVSAFSNIGDRTSGFYAERAVLNWNPLELNAGRAGFIRRYDIPDSPYSGRPTRRARVHTLPHFSDFAPRNRYLLENPYTVRYSPYELGREDAARWYQSVDPNYQQAINYRAMNNIASQEAANLWEMRKEFVSTATQTPSSWLAEERQKFYNVNHGMPSLPEQEEALNLSGDTTVKQEHNHYFWPARRDDAPQ